MLFRLLVVLLVVLPGCSAAGRIHDPIAEDASLPRSAPADVGLDAEQLGRISRQIAASDDHKLHSLLVVRHGRLAFEEYYHGHGPHNPHDLRSATKSITSLLTGIAIDQGALAGPDAPLMETLGPSYPDVQDKGDLTLRHLLTMQSGLDCDDGDRRTEGQEDRMYRSKDWVRTFLSLARPYAPGDTTRYCTGGVVALGEAIAQATGQDVPDFAEGTLFGPLGIANHRWARFDENRKTDTGGHLLLTPQGLAKIGLLVLQEGMWNGQRLVSANWIRRSTAPVTEIGGNPYGFLWWRNSLAYGPAGEQRYDVISARGNGGQVLFIVPEFELVVVMTGGYYNDDRVQRLYELFYRAVLPAVGELAHIRPSAP